MARSAAQNWGDALVIASGSPAVPATHISTLIPMQRGTVSAPVPADRPASGRRARARATLTSTPGRFAAAMVAILAIGLAYAAVALAGAVQRDNAVDRMRTTSGPLTVSAQSLYRSLFDADATAAAAFLSGGTEPKELRDRYDNDIAAASAALADISGDPTANRSSINTLTANLPVYAGLVETARADNRAGLPVGAAYLREASALMHSTLLGAATSVNRAESDGMEADRAAGAGFPWLALPLGVALIVVLAVTARLLARRTNRVFNIGVTTAILAVAISMIWMVASWGAATRHLDKARTDGSAQVKVLVTIRIAVLEARADESLTLVARGSDTEFEQDFQQVLTRILGKTNATGFLNSAQADATDPAVRKLISSVSTDLKGWQAAHKTLRQLDDAGDYPRAVQMATQERDTNLARAIDLTSKHFTAQGAAAASAQSGEAAAVTVLIALALVAATIGVQRRIAEYR